jgi:hypothetical protein
MLKWIAVLLLPVAVLSLLLWGAWACLQNRLVVENTSGQPIAVLKITIAGETILLQDIPAGTAVSCRFPIGSDDHFTVDDRLADGTRIAGDFGYVTNGMFRETIASCDASATRPAATPASTGSSRFAASTAKM